MVKFKTVSEVKRVQGMKFYAFVTFAKVLSSRKWIKLKKLKILEI